MEAEARGVMRGVTRGDPRPGANGWLGPTAAMTACGLMLVEGLVRRQVALEGELGVRMVLDVGMADEDVAGGVAEGVADSGEAGPSTEKESRARLAEDEAEALAASTRSLAEKTPVAAAEVPRAGSVPRRLT